MAKWFTMPEGIDSISLRQLEFHPKVVKDGVRYFSVPDHMADELLTLNIRTGMGPDGRPVFAKFEETARPEGVEDDPVEALEATDGAIGALNGQVMTLQVQMEGLRAQIAELTVERDELRSRVSAFEAESDEDRKAPIRPVSRGSNRVLGGGPHLTDSPPAEALMHELSSMTLGKD